MSTCNLFPPSVSSKISTAIAVLALLLCSSQAHADVYAVNPPDGWTGGRIYVGMKSNGKAQVVYRTGYSGNGACTWTKISEGATYGGSPVIVNGSIYADEIRYLHPSDSVSMGSGAGCSGVVLTGIPFSHAPTIDIYGSAGDDRAKIDTVNSELIAYLGSGRDIAWVSAIASVWGGSGDDDIMVGTTAQTTYVFGDAGLDFFCVTFSPIASLNGGADGAWRRGHASTMLFITGYLESEDCNTVALEIAEVFAE